MASPEELEVALLGAIRSSKELDFVRAATLSPDDFLNEKNRMLFEHLLQCELAERSFPSIDDKKLVWGVEVGNNNDDVYGIALQIHKDATTRRVRSALIRTSERIDDDPDDVIANLISELSSMKTNVANRARSLSKLAVERYEKLEERARIAASGRFIGMPTGIQYFEPDNVGIQPGELVTIIGKSGVGKSWLMSAMAASIYRAGFGVLYISPEMAAFESEIRIDTILMNRDGHEANHRGLLKGERNALDNYSRWISTIKDDGRWITVDADASGGFSASAIFDLAQTHRPDLLCIDGFHLLAGKRSGGQGWETIKHNADAIKALGQLKGMGIICVTQAQRNAGIDDNPTAEQVAYGYSLIEASDRVASIASVRGQQDKKTVKLLKDRARELPIYRAYMQFDVNRGDIRQLRNEEVGGPTEEDF